MIDRLLSGAGAVSHAADRVVRVVLRGPAAASRPVGAMLAVLLLVLAVAGIAGAVDNSGDRTLHEVSPREIATGGPRDRTYASVRGSVASAYVESYRDINDDGKQSPDETGLAWDYFLVDTTTRSGVVVDSERPPSEVFAYHTRGVVVHDEEYLAEDLAQFKDITTDLGVTLEPARYIDATKYGLPFQPFDLGDGVPKTGAPVEVQGARAGDYLVICSADPDHDGQCSEDEVDYWDVLVYDPVSHNAVIVLTQESPEFAPATFTGLLRKAPARVTAAQKIDNGAFTLSDIGISVSPDYILDDGSAPTEPVSLLVPAVVAALVAGVILIGSVAGPVRFKRSGATVRAASSGPTMTAGARVPVHVTGVLRAPRKLVRVREARGDLVRFVLTPVRAITPAAPAGAVPVADAPAVPDVDAGPPTTLIVERAHRLEGVALGRGELRSLELGQVVPFRGSRPALRVEAGTGTLLLSFDSEAARDQAAAELAAESGIGGVG